MWTVGCGDGPSLANRRGQPGDDLALRGENLPPGVGGRKPLRAVDFRKRRLAPALRRPFQLEPVRGQRRGIEIAFESPGGDDLAAGLDDLTERKEIALRTGPGLLFEFALGHRERVLAFGIFPFRDRPSAQVLLGPERAARMHEQNLDLVTASSEHQNAGAALGHGTLSPGFRRAAGPLTSGYAGRSPASPRPKSSRRPGHAKPAPRAPPDGGGSA